MSGFRPISGWPDFARWREAGGRALLLLVLACAFLSFAPVARAQEILVVNQSFACSKTNQEPIIQQSSMPDPSKTGLDEPLKHVLVTWQAALFNSVAFGYCGMVELVKPPLMAAAMLAVIIYALSFLFGLTSLSARGTMILIFKISLVLMFALNAEIAMKVIYGFFLSVSQDAISWMNIGTDKPLLSQDKSLRDFAALFSDHPPPGATADAKACAGTVMFFLLFVLIAFPIIGGPVFAMFLTFLFMFIRAMLGFLVALGAVALLMAASPMFIAFAMFRTTHSFFDRWLQAIISYTLQMIIVFAIILIAFKIFDFWAMFTGLVQTMRISPGMIKQIQGYDFTFGGRIDDVTKGVQFCTPCRGGHFSMTLAMKAGAPPFSGFSCPPHAGGVSFFEAFIQYEFFKFLLFNGMLVTMVLWGINEILEAMPSIAQTLAGSGYAMNLGGGGANNDSRGGFGFGTFDKASRNFTAGFRYGYDPGFQMDTKTAIRKVDPTYLDPGGPVEAVPNRFKIAFQQGAAFAGSSHTPEEIYALEVDKYSRIDELRQTKEKQALNETRIMTEQNRIADLEEQEQTERVREDLRKERETLQRFFDEQAKLRKELVERNAEVNEAKKRMEGEDVEV